MPGKYYLIVENQRRGPFSKEELETQGLRRDTLVWCKGLPDWAAAGRVPELLEVFDEPPPLPGEVPPLPALASEQIKDPAVNVPRESIAPPIYSDDGETLSLARPSWRIPYDAIGMRRLYLAAMGTYVPGLVLLLLAGVTIAWLGIHGVQMHTPRFDPQQRTIRFDFDPAARNLETFGAVLASGAAILGAIGLAVGFACSVVFLYRAWRIVYDGRSGPSPGRAIGFMFIPFFNIYWVYVALWGLTRSLNRFVRRHDLDVPSASQPLGLGICVYSSLTYLPFPFAGLFPLALNLVLWPFFMRSVYRTTVAICADANRERVAQTPLERRLRQPELPRPVSAHALSITAMVLALIGTAMFAIGFGVSLDALRHYHRDVPMAEAQRQAINHLVQQKQNPADVNALRSFQNQLNNTEHQLGRWRDQLIVSTAVIGGGTLLLAITIALAVMARYCANAPDDLMPQAPPAWPVTHGAGFLAKNAESPVRHSSPSRGAALP